MDEGKVNNELLLEYKPKNRMVEAWGYMRQMSITNVLLVFAGLLIIGLFSIIAMVVSVDTKKSVQMPEAARHPSLCTEMVDEQGKIRALIKLTFMPDENKIRRDVKWISTESPETISIYGPVTNASPPLKFMLANGKIDSSLNTSETSILYNQQADVINNHMDYILRIETENHRTGKLEGWVLFSCLGPNYMYSIQHDGDSAASSAYPLFGLLLLSFSLSVAL